MTSTRVHRLTVSHGAKVCFRGSGSRARLATGQPLLYLVAVLVTQLELRQGALRGRGVPARFRR